MNKKIILRLTLISTIVGGGFQAFFLLSLSIGGFYLRFFSVSQMINDSIAIIFPIFIIWLVGFAGFSIKLYQFLIKKLKNTNFEVIHKWWEVTVHILFIFLSVIVLFLIKTQTINKILISPSHFINKKYICDELLDNKCRIRYFNDKYIFIEKDNKKIEIIKFDNFFK